VSIIRRPPPKELEWIGASRREIQAFSDRARNDAGRELRRVQRGFAPEDSKPLESVGPGTAELRVRTFEGGVVQRRVVYVAKFPEAVYVLHAFEKKTEKTAPHHLEVAAKRYREMLRLRAFRKEQP
jgi:phage-related protein